MYDKTCIYLQYYHYLNRQPLCTYPKTYTVYILSKYLYTTCILNTPPPQINNEYANTFDYKICFIITQ